VTFTRDVAPILYRSCAPCHRPGGAAPFSLLHYADALRHAPEIAQVTASRFMPPWLPEPGWVEWAGERRLSPAEIDLLARWVEGGRAEGDPAELPPLPRWPTGWREGEPDLVVAMPEPFPLPAAGPDLFRNFVLPVDLDAARHVRAVEIRPEDPRRVHHAILEIDRSGSCRGLDAADPGPGFGGMFLGDAERPGGQFLGWTPGKTALSGLPGAAWRLVPGDDLVLQLHMPPTGKPEAVRVAVGLYFATEPPTLHPFGLLLGSEELDIPAGEPAYRVTDRFVLPVPVLAHGVYPHAHYLARSLHATARLPDGALRWLLRIDRWDFDWQDEYRYREPIPLPAGTEITMEYTYDNSAANPRNPHHPPRRVVFGPESTDEMAFLLLQVAPLDPAHRPALEEAQLTRTLEKNPGAWRARLALGDRLAARGDLAGAAASYRRALEQAPGEALLRGRLGRVLGMAGQLDEAVPHLRAAVRLAPEEAAGHNDLGVALETLGRLDEAQAAYVRAVALEPGYPEARINLARVLLRRGNRSTAREHLRQAQSALSADDPRSVEVKRLLAAAGE
jgi:tetratricopeptide (TPR) repeat protein